MRPPPVVLALGVPLAAMAGHAGEPRDRGAPSFTRDVAPVIQQKCSRCHRLGGIAPVPFDTAREISSRSAMIAANVQARLMPPWPPGPSSPSYAVEQERRLSDPERTLLAGRRREGESTARRGNPFATKPSRSSPESRSSRSACLPRTSRGRAKG